MSDDNVIEAQSLTKRYRRGHRRSTASRSRSARGEIFGAARPERRRQDHDHPDDARPERHHRRTGRACSATIRCASRSQVKRRVGYLPDAVGFYDNLTAADNLRYTARLIGLERAEREERIKASLDAVSGLPDVTDKRGRRPSRAACASGSASPKS